MHYAFDFAIVCSLVAAGASWMRGGKYVHQEAPLSEEMEYGWIDETDLAIPALDSGASSVYSPPSQPATNPVSSQPSTRNQRTDLP